MPRPSGKSRRSHHYQGTTYQELLTRLAANVRGLRTAGGWTQEEAAHRCGMTTAFFQSIEGEGTNPTGTTLARLADGLGADVGALLIPAAPLPPRRPGRPPKQGAPPAPGSAPTGLVEAIPTGDEAGRTERAVEDGAGAGSTTSQGRPRTPLDPGSA